MADKIFISANQLLEDSFELATQVLDSGYQPDLIVGIWRGGAPIAIATHEVLAVAGFNPDHIPVRAQSYSGIHQRSASVELSGLGYIAERTGKFNRLLLVDDVFDSGQTLNALITRIYELYGLGPTDNQAQPSSQTSGSRPEIRIATPWYKPRRNTTLLSPDFYLHTTDAWLVFPHELCGVDKAELLEHKPGAKKVSRHLA